MRHSAGWWPLLDLESGVQSQGHFWGKSCPSLSLIPCSWLVTAPQPPCISCRRRGGWLNFLSGLQQDPLSHAFSFQWDNETSPLNWAASHSGRKWYHRIPEAIKDDMASMWGIHAGFQPPCSEDPWVFWPLDVPASTARDSMCGSHSAEHHNPRTET